MAKYFRSVAAFFMAAALFLLSGPAAYCLSDAFKDNVYDRGSMKPVDSVLKVKVGDPAPDFTLRSLSGELVSLSDYRGKKNVMLSFIPAAWTPVCSDQWPGYNIVKDIFDSNDAILLGISVDNIPTLYSWTNQMGQLWFPVLSDFYPHGEVSSRFGILRSEGIAERAVFIIDKQGIIRYIHVKDINQRPPLEVLVRELEKLQQPPAGGLK
ncbi:peroxiredoxin [Syntrophus sp. (in: bacteria)]|uniref:peroxiredoxin n=1 Tax=Syntrophus sp. (in: bacteria) TaxID=48412 RepID=UPI00345EDFD3